MFRGFTIHRSSISAIVSECGGIRTHGLFLRREALYPAELHILAKTNCRGNFDMSKEDIERWSEIIFSLSFIVYIPECPIFSGIVSINKIYMTHVERSK